MSFVRDCALHGTPEPFAVELSSTDGQREGRLLVSFEQIEDFDAAFVIEHAYQEIEGALRRARGDA